MCVCVCVCVCVCGGGGGGGEAHPGAQPLENLRILGLLDAWKLHFQHLKRETSFAYIEEKNILRSKEGNLNELGCKDGGNVIFWLVLKTYKRHYLEINVKEMKHFDDHSHMKKM